MYAQNVFYSVELDYIWFAGGYGALYACTKRFFTVWMARWDLVTFDLRAATALSTHAQNASYKLFVEIVWEEKVRRRREKMKYKS